jgi:hypothetical protein
LSKIRVELDRAGVRELLQSAEVIAVLSAEAQSRAASLPPGYSVNTYVGRNRANAEIRADTDEAVRDNLENNTLLRAIS